VVGGCNCCADNEEYGVEYLISVLTYCGIFCMAYRLPEHWIWAWSAPGSLVQIVFASHETECGDFVLQRVRSHLGRWSG